MTLRDTIERLTKEAKPSPMTYDLYLAIVVDALLVWAEEVERRLAGEPRGEPPPEPRPGETDEAYWQRMRAEGRLAPDLEARLFGGVQGPLSPETCPCTDPTAPYPYPAHQPPVGPPPPLADKEA